MTGFVYVITNPHMPGVVKLGAQSAIPWNVSLH